MSDSAPKPWYIVRRSSIHQRGVFARRDIPKGTRIIEYVGERITKAESKRRADALIEKSKKTGGAAVYIFDINKRIDLDGDVKYNTARLINHSCEPNCEVFDERSRIWIYAKRAIRKGEELCYNYGFDLEHWDEHPCRCGSAQCVGHIVHRKHWKRLHKLIANKKLQAGAKKAARREGHESPADVMHAGPRA